MTTSQIFKFTSAAASTTGPSATTVLPGKATSLTPRVPTALRIAEGHAWITLDDGPHGSGAEAGDVFLHAGQTLRIAAGQHAVVEPLGGQRLQYRLSAVMASATDGSPAPWWRRAAFGSAAGTDQRAMADACCA